MHIQVEFARSLHVVLTTSAIAKNPLKTVLVTKTTLKTATVKA